MLECDTTQVKEQTILHKASIGQKLCEGDPFILLHSNYYDWPERAKHLFLAHFTLNYSLLSQRRFLLG